MKRYVYSIIPLVISIIVCAGCSKVTEIVEQNNIKEENVLEATFAQNSNTKTSLSTLENGVYKALWSAGDHIGVFVDGANTLYNYELVSGENTPEASFKGYGKGESYVALYPVGMARRIIRNALELELPAEQLYSENSFGQDSYPMLAVSNTSSLVFKNTCTILVVPITGNASVQSISFIPNDGSIGVSGSASIDLSDYDAPGLVMAEGAGNAVTLKCDGVDLNEQTAKEFYIVLPPQTYKGGFTLAVATSAGVMKKTVTEDISLGRSEIRRLKTFSFEREQILAGAGTQQSPFLIYDLEDLLLMQRAVNSENGVIIPSVSNEPVVAHKAYYRLMSDISLEAVCQGNNSNWIPIANRAENAAYVFDGVFDGNGYTISDLYINSESDYQGFFGYFNGSIKNLSVEGYVRGDSYCGLVTGAVGAYSGKSIENCKSYGTVEAAGIYAGGIAGLVTCSVSNCINYANISGKKSFIGGLIGDSRSSMAGCINYGNVSSEGLHGCGGIVGHLYVGSMSNCFNEGKVEGTEVVGGIAGEIARSAKIYNCYNKGEVVGNLGKMSELGMEGTQWAGISGIVGFSYPEANYIPEVKNCLNLGTVSNRKVSENVGAILGNNKDEIIISNCYWLYDEQNNVGMKEGVGVMHVLGHMESCYALTQEQIKGNAPIQNTLYISDDNVVYRKLLNALNALAYDINNSGSYKLSGWIYGPDSGYPEFGGMVAQRPSDEMEPVFEVSPGEFNLSYIENEITVKVISNMDYSIESMPEWITESGMDEINTGGMVYTHIFKVCENPNSEHRQGEIRFCSDNGQRISVRINQEANRNEDKSWVEKEFWHKSVALRFTADWCGWCPLMATSLDNAKKQMLDKLEVLSLHADGGLKCETSVILAEAFSVKQYPKAFVDGNMNTVSNSTDIPEVVSNVISLAKTMEENFKTVAGTSWNSTIKDNKISLDLNVYFKEAGSYKVTALLVEDNIVGYQADNINGSSNEYVHNNVVRSAFSDALGDSAVITYNGEKKQYNYSLDIPSVCNKDNLRIVVFVQAQQANGAYLINNSASAAVGKQQPLMVKSNNSDGLEWVVPGDDIPYNN